MTKKRTAIIQWRCFVEAVSCGSMLKASEVLQMEVSEVSQQIKALEETLGETLLERNQRGVRPTWAGQKRLNAAKELIRVVEEVFRKKTAKRTSLRVAVPVSIGRLFLDWIGQFEKELGETASIEVIQFVENSPYDLWSFDLFICKDTLPNERIIARTLGGVERGICASPNLFKDRRLPKFPEELLEFPLAMRQGKEELLSTNTEKMRIKTSPQFLVNSSYALIDTAVLGHAVAVGVPLWAIKEELVSGKLIRILPEWKLEPTVVWGVWKPQEGKNPMTKKLYSYFQERWRTEPGLINDGTESLQSAYTGFH